MMRDCINIKNSFISKSRMSHYRSLDEYIDNLYLSNSFYIPLSILEVSLRNSLNIYFIKKVNKNWLFDRNFIKPYMEDRINTAIKILKQQNKDITQDNIIAELSFSFWILLLKNLTKNT